jgi:hypothetical protein
LLFSCWFFTAQHCLIQHRRVTVVRYNLPFSLSSTFVSPKTP